MDEFEVIAASLLAEERDEQAEHARQVLTAGDAERGFAGVVRRLPAGDVVTLTTVDGAHLRGRVVRVGADWLRLVEVVDEMGTARVRGRRIHEVRLNAVVRVSRESDR